MIRRVLAAVDDSPRASFVIARAKEIARAAGASMRLYHAVAIPPGFPPAAALATGDPLPAHLHKVAVERLSGLAKSLEGIPFDVIVDEAQPPARAILDAAAAYDADLVVIGSHGYNFIEHLLGTTAAHVVHASTRDVLVVRQMSTQ